VPYTSYRQTVRAYRSNGGAYTVSKANLDTNASKLDNRAAPTKRRPFQEFISIRRRKSDVLSRWIFPDVWRRFAPISAVLYPR
jgi:hypothetical protein